MTTSDTAPAPAGADSAVKAEIVQELTDAALSVPQVATMLSISEHEVRTMIKYGALEAWRVGKNMKISAASVRRFHNGPGNAADPEAIARAAAKRAAS